MAIAESAAPRFQIGRVVKRTFGVVARNFSVFALLSLLTALPSGAWSWYQASGGVSQFSFVGLLVFIAAWFAWLMSAFVLQAAVVHGTVADLNGTRASFIGCLSTGLKHLVPLLGIALLYGLYVGIGLILLLVPGIIVAVMMCMAVPARVVERLGVMAAFDRSQELTSGYRWPIFGLFVVFFIAQMMISAVIVSMGGLSFVAMSAEVSFYTISWPIIVTSTIASMVNSVLSAAGAASIYYELRQIKEGVGPEALAAVFD
jgi:hypothetical protein